MSVANFAVAMLDGSYELSDALSLPQNGGRKELHTFVCSVMAVPHTDFDAQQPASSVPMWLDTRLDLSPAADPPLVSCHIGA